MKIALKRFCIMRRVQPVLYVVVALLALHFVQSVGIRAILITVALGFSSRLAPELWAHVYPPSHSSGLRNATNGLSWIIGSSYYIVHRQSTFGLALSLIALLWSILATVTGLHWFLLDVALFSALSRDFRLRRPPRLMSTPLVYLLTEKGVDATFVYQLVGKTTMALSKYRTALPSELTKVARSTVLTRLLRESRRGRAVFLWSESIKSCSPLFREWIAANVECVVIVRSAFGAPSDPNAFVSSMTDQVKRSLGPVLGLVLKLPGVTWQPTFECVGMWVDRIEVGIGQPGRGVTDFIAPLTETLANTTVPISLSDNALAENLRQQIPQIGSDCLVPIADCYLRFRLSRSDVERFLSLMDAFECFTKLSFLILFTIADKADSVDEPVGRLPDFAKQLEKGMLAFGAWHRLLSALAASQLERNASDDAELLRCFWRSNLASAQATLVTRIATKNSWGLKCLDPHATQLDWINWIRELRNATKGHGVLQDQTVRDILHPLHECLLFAISELRDILLSSRLCPDGSSTPIRGWRRDISRWDLPSNADNQFLTTTLHLASGAKAGFGKYVLTRNSSVFIWDGIESSGRGPGKYLDYLTGERLQIEP